MDGSTYRPQREDPHGQSVETGANRSFVLLAILSAVIGGAFFFIHREQAVNFINCLTGTGEACAAIQASPSPSSAQ